MRSKRIRQPYSITNLKNEMDRLFNNFFSDSWPGVNGQGEAHAPAVDLWEDNGKRL